MKQPTKEDLATMVGGQMEIQNAVNGYNFCGELRELAIANGELRAKFVWMARLQGNGYWIKDGLTTYIASLDIYTFEEIKPNAGEVGGDRWRLSSFIAGETVIIYPPGAGKLDPALVIGLDHIAA